MSDKTIYFSFHGEINVYSSSNLIYACNEAIKKGKKHIYISFASRGGFSDSGFYLYNNLKSMDVEITFHNTGSVESAGLTTFLAGDNRYASPHSRFLLHQPFRKFPANTSYDSRDLSEFSQLLKNDELTIKNIITENSSASKPKINSWFKLSKIFTPSEANTNGIITAIKDFTVPTTHNLITISTEKV